MNNFKGQTKRPNKSKNERGITLVALIITIIILIILAAVTINSLTHDGLADMAIKGAQDYDKAQQTEMNMLNDIDAMVKETLKNIEDGTTKPGPKPDPDESKPDPDEPIPPTTPDFSDTIELANNNIGNSVDYTPKAGQTYSTTQNGTEYSGASKQDFSTSDLTGTWSLWGVDDKNIYVISDNTTSNKLTLANHLGYNNGVTLLDTICDTCFTDKTTYPNMKGQNLKLEQVLDVTTATNNYASQYNNAPYTYSFKYPYIWNQYEKTQSDSQANRSTAYPLTTQTALSSNISAQPYYTFWYSDKQNTSSAWKNAGYYRMVMTPAQSNAYWLSSRCVYPYGSSGCYFSLQIVASNGMYNGGTYYYSSGSPNSMSNRYAVRPLVSFPMADYALQENGNTIKIVKRG